MSIEQSLHKLKIYCESEGFKGWDPYDGLNSRLFQKLPLLKKSALCRLAVIQGFKRSPVNLRKMAFVSKDYNAKGIALFLSGYCNLYKAVKNNSGLVSRYGTEQEILSAINNLASLLIKLQSQGNYHGACWGYNFDWQCRRSFLFPKNTPTVVTTTFAAMALISAYEITGNTQYRDVALSSAEFVLNDLHRTPHGDGFIFSYAPIPGNDTVYNASLLGSRLLAACYKYTGKNEYLEAARASIRACVQGQQSDGSWAYGMLPVQSWVDSFHTGYNLVALYDYARYTGDHSFDSYMQKGLDYYLENFFLEDGTPKYYNNQVYPVDIHCPGQLLITLSVMGIYKEHKSLADKVLKWTLDNMQDKKGYFYYQLKKGMNTKISYMRWSNAFMFCALSYIAAEC